MQSLINSDWKIEKKKSEFLCQAPEVWPIKKRTKPKMSIIWQKKNIPCITWLVTNGTVIQILSTRAPVIFTCVASWTVFHILNVWSQQIHWELKDTEYQHPEFWRHFFQMSIYTTGYFIFEAAKWRTYVNCYHLFLLWIIMTENFSGRNSLSDSIISSQRKVFQ